MPFAPEIALHQITRQLCVAFIREPQTGLLLHGANGSGLLTIASGIAEALNEQPDAMRIITSEDGKDISIDQIRQLYHDTRSSRHNHLTIIIDDADRMSLPAQNAFLKLLEEPPAHVVFVLTTHSPQLLLPTIHSRVATIEVRALSRHDTERFITEKGIDDPTRRVQLMFLSSGRPAGLVKLIEDEEYFTQRSEMIRVARNVVTGSTYQRLVALKDVMNDRDSAIETVQTIGHIVTYSDKKSHGARTANHMAVIAETIDKLQANANVRLQLLNLALHL